MTQQVSRSLQFYLASGGGREQPDMVLVCGGCANIPGIADVISSRVGIPDRGRRPSRSDENIFQGQIAGRAQGFDGIADCVWSRTEELRLICHALIYSHGARQNESQTATRFPGRNGQLPWWRRIIVVGLTIVTYNSMINHQLDRNNSPHHGNSEELDKSISEIDGLEAAKRTAAGAHGNH